ncbi:MAG: hypothetical protein SO468_02395 [Prevotella sp.]|nr:hypothetical protein [Prevotella sp.]
MNINISQILEDLSQVKMLLECFLQNGTLAISEERLIVDFFIHYQSTNDLVSEAIEQIRSEAEGALDMFAGIQHDMEAFLVFYSNNEKKLNALDFKRDCSRYLEQFDNAYKSASTEATSTWKQVQKLSNKLDFMWEKDEKYPTLRKECDEKESLYYNTLKPQVDRLFAEYKKQEEYIAPVYYFEMDMLIVLIAKIRDIAASAIEDIQTIRKGAGE